MNAPPRAYLRIRVLARAARTAIARDSDGLLRIHLTAVPSEGAANRALVDLLADRLEVPKSSLEIKRGGRTRDKLVCVHGCSAAEVDRRLSRALSPPGPRSESPGVAGGATCRVDKRGRRG